MADIMGVASAFVFIVFYLIGCDYCHALSV
jgi:hypothetical protein